MAGETTCDQGNAFSHARRTVARDTTKRELALQLSMAAVLLFIGLAYAIFVGVFLELGRKLLEISIACFQIVFVSVIVGKFLVETARGRLERWLKPFMVWTSACLSLLATALAMLTILDHLSERSLEFWQIWAWRILVFSLLVHGAGTAALLCVESIRRRLYGRSLEKYLSATLLLIFCSLVFNFHVEPSNRWLNPLFQFVFAPGLSQSTTFGSILSIALAVLTFLGCLAVARFEQMLVEARHPAAGYFARIGLPLVMLATVVFYFDFRLPSDPMHYLTNVGPAVRLAHGGVPLVDAFSQYGPGPMIATWAAFSVMPPTLGTANIAVQCFNLLFFLIVLVCLSRLVAARVAAMMLGSAIISVLLGCWGGGFSDLAGAPSNMGFRYLWPATMVLAISVLPSSRTYSSRTAAAGAVSALWSVETLVASAVIQVSFMVAVRLARREPGILMKELPIAILPMVIAISAFSILIFLWSGQFPDYGIYLRFLGVYNAFSDYWGIASVNSFWGWIPFLIVLSLVMSLVWKLLLSGATAGAEKAECDLLFGYLPMTALAASISLYYLGRSVDFVLLLALLPISCIVLAPFFNALSSWRECGRLALTWAGIISISIVWGLSAGFAYLYRPGTPYHMAFHECRYAGHCSVSDLVSTLGSAIENEPVIRTISYVGSDGERLIDEAVSLIHTNFQGEQASVFLGTLHGRSLVTDLALFRAGKSHRWPISYTFTDELVPQLAQRIAASPIELKDGDPVIVRRDETTLGPLEMEILRQLRNRVRLCPRDVSAALVTYVVSHDAKCEPRH